MKTKQALGMLSALAQDSRLAIFRLLVEHAPEGMVAGEIGKHLDMANATLSFHLKELAHAGLVTRRPSGRHIHYAARIKSMDDLMAYLMENCCASSELACEPPRRRARDSKKV